MSCKKCKRLIFITDYESWLDFTDGTIMCPACYEPMDEICSLMTDGSLGLFDEEMDYVVRVLKELSDDGLKQYKANVKLIIEKYESFGLYKYDDHIKYDEDDQEYWAKFYFSILNYKPEDDTHEGDESYKVSNRVLSKISNKYAEMIQSDLRPTGANISESSIALLKHDLFNILNNIYGAE